MMYQTLFSTATIGSLTLKNRIVMTAMGCGLANKDGTLSDEFIAYYAERAKGGTGLLITEVTRVNEKHGARSDRQICATSDAHIPSLRKLADAVHEQGACIFTQLHHPGNITMCAFNGNEPLVSASDIPSRVMKQPTRALTVEEIHGLVMDFATAAKRVQAAGIDGVEIHAAHFYLIHQFLTPYFNKRTDEYGGSLENRMRFLKEIVLAIRATCGRSFPVMVRLSVEEYLGESGFYLPESLKVAQMLESIGVDAINVSAGGPESGSQSVEPISYNPGWRKHLAAAVKKAVTIPVCMVSIIRTPDFAEELLQSGVTDFVGTGRSHLADPNWAKKAKEGCASDIRRCISCLRCIESIKNDQPICCSVNAECGKELRKAALNSNGDGRKVVVIGAGPAGLEAARIAALRGFSVTLFEQNELTGGQVRLASNVPLKEKMSWFLDYELKQCRKLGVDIRTGARASIETVKAMQPYAIIEATGSVPIVPRSIPGSDKSCVCTPVDILSGKRKIRNASVVVIGSGMTGLETAEYLIQDDNAVTIVEMAPCVAPGANVSNVNDVLKRLALKDVVYMTNCKLCKIDEDRIYLANVVTGEEWMLPCDHVVLSLGVCPNRQYGDQLNEACENVLTIGDVAKSGRILEAVSGGYDAGHKL